ncbi:oligoribonuclease nrnB [Paenibacillus sp. MMS20-IR301]|uniref:DHH family phosphoesterase n=1 Tax=Paenibacillus sp. MMS20-IR301 TaxID=2895946 RepID=UPI0028E9B66C|nr:oligoribonuclease nrnB [Paenibacillus sp. MMS20-IR301]WNS43944.1 oligoribonuclease nrnB [Paenibacillus sp. MMS20-IR301]
MDFSHVKLSRNSFQKVIHVSHNDLDGLSPIVLSRIAFAGKELLTKYCNYNRVDDIVLDLLEEEMDHMSVMFITDINVSEDVAAEIDEYVDKGYRIYVLDHHDPKPAMPVESYRHWMYLQNTYPDGRGTAATSIFYEFLLGQGLLTSSLIMDDYVELVRLYDTWEWPDGDKSNRRAKRMNDYLFMSDPKDFCDQVILRLTSAQAQASFSFEPQAEHLIDQEQQRIEDYCMEKKQGMRCFQGQVDGTGRIYTYAVMIAELYQSELGDMVCSEGIGELDFVVMIDLPKNKLSLRSNKATPVDVGAIARSLGGGGRAQTAGCPLNELTKPLFLDPLTD